MTSAPAKLLILAIVLLGCTGQQAPVPSGKGPTGPVSSEAGPSPWESKLDQLVTVEGEAEDAKLGALLVAGSGTIWVDGIESWPLEVRGKRVQVTGKVIQRSDLPVFVHQEGEPEMQGIPVPPGT